MDRCTRALVTGLGTRAKVGGGKVCVLIFVEQALQLTGALGDLKTRRRGPGSAFEPREVATTCEGDPDGPVECIAAQEGLAATATITSGTVATSSAAKGSIWDG